MLDPSLALSKENQSNLAPLKLLSSRPFDFLFLIYVLRPAECATIRNFVTPSA